MNPSAVPAFLAFLHSSQIQQFLIRGQIIGARLLPPSDVAASLIDADPSSVLVEHDRVWFPSYPYEWPPEMLHAAAVLTLDMAESVLADGLGLKDALLSRYRLSGGLVIH